MEILKVRMRLTRYKKKKEKKLNPQVIPSQDQTKVTLVESYEDTPHTELHHLNEI